MSQILRYLIRYMLRCWPRLALTAAGLSLAISAVIFAYGVSASVVDASSKGLSFVLNSGTLWIVPGAGVRLSPATGLILPNGFIDDETVKRLTTLDQEAKLEKVIAGETVIMGKSAVIYGSNYYEESDGATASQDFQKIVGNIPAAVSIGGKELLIARFDSQLPSSTITTSFSKANAIFGLTNNVGWLLCRHTDGVRWVTEASKVEGVRVTDTPDINPEGQRIKAVAYLIEGSLSRFSPFSFHTKFSSLILNRSISTVLGRVSQVIFLLGLAMALTSSLIGIWEKRDEIALFAAKGLVASTTVMFLVEASIIQLASFAIGSIVGLLTLKQLIGQPLHADVLGLTFTIGFIYLSILIATTTLIAANTVASRTPIDLIRSSAY